MSCMKDGFVEGMCLDGRYVTVSPLNHGSFGMVFLAKDTANDELVAIKCLAKAAPADLGGNDHLIELLCHDRLGRHRNIVNLLHAFETEAHMFLVLEFCSMGDLYEAIRLGRGPLQTEHVRDFMLQLVDAIEYMHARGLYHRDIKPENIFLAQDGTMKLGDFGLSTTENWTHEACVGSDRYMAPEQFDPSDTGYSPAQADVWSIGVCLLNILFSRNPFVTPSESDVLFADFVRDRQSLFDVFPSMSQDTFEVLMQAVALDPTKRSLPALRDALKRVVTFTTDEDVLDDFCTEDREVVQATANRQPLRTPSIQSPPVEQGGAFPWAKALQMSPPQAHRQLSVIPDTENDADSLFPEQGSAAWYRTAHCEDDAKLSSVASVLDSALGASVKSMTLQEPKPRKLSSPLSSSVPPPTAAKPIAGAMSSVFGKKDAVVSKSWSDLWDEEEEEREEDARRSFNARNWSSETLDEDLTIGRSDANPKAAEPAPAVSAAVLGEIKNPAAAGGRVRSPPARLDGLALYNEESSASSSSSNEDVSSFETTSPQSPPLYSPPAKRSVFFDKWAALGNRRRAIGSQPATPVQATSGADGPVDANATPRNKKRGGASGASGRRAFKIKAFSGNSGRGDKDNGVYRHNANTGSAVWDRSDRERKDHSASHIYQPPKSAGLIPSYSLFGSGPGVKDSTHSFGKASGGVRIRDWRRDPHQVHRYYDRSFFEGGLFFGSGRNGKGNGNGNGNEKHGAGANKGTGKGINGAGAGHSTGRSGNGSGVLGGKRDSFVVGDFDAFVDVGDDDGLGFSGVAGAGADGANDDLEWVGGWHDLHL